MFDELIDAICCQDGGIVGISGHAGSGKTTLARRIGNALGLSSPQIVHLDDLYNAKSERKGGMFDDYDWVLLKEIISAFREGGRISYIGRGYYSDDDTFVVEADRPRALIVEGIRLFNAMTVGFFDIKIWINCSPETANQRAIRREMLRGKPEDVIELLKNVWLPANSHYFEFYRPDLQCDFIFECDE